MKHRPGELLLGMAILAMTILCSCGSSSDGAAGGGGVSTATTTTTALSATPAPTMPPVPTTTPLPTVTAPAAVIVEADYVTSDTDDATHLTLGETVFVAKCAGCHGTSGAGSDRGRSLIDIAAEEPDRLVHIDSVTYGKGDMLLRPGLLTPEEIDAVISYVRLSLVAEPAQETIGQTPTATP